MVIFVGDSLDIVSGFVFFPNKLIPFSSRVSIPSVIGYFVHTSYCLTWGCFADRIAFENKPSVVNNINPSETLSSLPIA